MTETPITIKNEETFLKDLLRILEFSEILDLQYVKIFIHSVRVTRHVRVT